MIENKWANGGIAVAFAGVLAGLAVWMSSGPSPDHAPGGGGQSGQVDEDIPVAPADRPIQEPPTKGRGDDEPEAAPPDAGSIPLSRTSTGDNIEPQPAPADMGGSVPGPPPSNG